MKTIVRKMTVVILLVMFTILVSCDKSEVVLGCTDANALNFNSGATDEDGTCYYSNTNNPTNNETTTITIREDLPTNVDIILVITEKRTGNTNEYIVPTIQPNFPFSIPINNDYILSKIKITTMSISGNVTEEYRITNQGFIDTFDKNNQIAIGINKYIKLHYTTSWNFEVIQN